MKELNLEQMEVIQGGVNCYLGGLQYIIGCATFSWPNMFEGMIIMHYCWNS